MVDYKPVSNGEEHNAHDNSIEINIHLMEESEKNQGAHQYKSLLVMAVSFFLQLPFTN